MIIINVFTTIIDFIGTIVTFLPDKINVILFPFIGIYLILLVYKFKN